MGANVASDDCVSLREQFVLQHSSRIPGAAKETLPVVKAQLGLRRRIFLSEPHGTMRDRILEDSTLITSNRIFQKLLLAWANKGKLINGCPDEPVRGMSGGGGGVATEVRLR